MTSALLIVGHGTRSADGAAECSSLADRVRAGRPGLAVAVGNLELCRPTIPEALGGLAAAGAADVTALPLVLLSARHAKRDIPAALAAQEARHPGVRVHRGQPLGVHPWLVEVVEDRIRARVPAARREQTAVLLVRAGSTDPEARPDLARVAKLLARRGGHPVVETAFAGIAEPGVDAGLQRLRERDHRHVAVVPYLLFAGHLAARVAQQTAAFAAAHPDMTVTATDHLGADPRIAALVLERYDQARRDASLSRSEGLDACRAWRESER